MLTGRLQLDGPPLRRPSEPNVPIGIVQWTRWLTDSTERQNGLELAALLARVTGWTQVKTREVCSDRDGLATRRGSQSESSRSDSSQVWIVSAFAHCCFFVKYHIRLHIEKGRSTQLAELPTSDRRPLMQRFFTVVISYNENVAVRRNDPKDVKKQQAGGRGGDCACLACALVGGGRGCRSGVGPVGSSAIEICGVIHKCYYRAPHSFM